RRANRPAPTRPGCGRGSGQDDQSPDERDEGSGEEPRFRKGSRDPRPPARAQGSPHFRLIPLPRASRRHRFTCIAKGDTQMRLVQRIFVFAAAVVLIMVAPDGSSKSAAKDRVVPIEKMQFKPANPGVTRAVLWGDRTTCYYG